MTRFLALPIWISLVFSCGSITGFAQTMDASETTRDDDTANQIHDSLRELRDRLFQAYEDRDMDALLSDVADNVVITWQNADRNEGHQEFLDFYQEMMSGENRIVQDINSRFNVDDDSILYGNDTAVARGTLDDTFSLRDGSQFTLNSKWTATVVKDSGKWKVASFHVSTNVFDNPILGFAKSWLAKAALPGLAVGVLAGMIIGFLWGRRSGRVKSNA